MKTTYIVDVRFRQRNAVFEILKDRISEDTEVLALTPYASYLLERVPCKPLAFESVIDPEVFHAEAMSECRELETLFRKYPDFSFLFIEICKTHVHEKYVTALYAFIEREKRSGNRVVYIGDAEPGRGEASSGHCNTVHPFGEGSGVDECVRLQTRDAKFYIRRKIHFLIRRVFQTNEKWLRLKRKLSGSRNLIDLSYDNLRYIKWIRSLKPAKVRPCALDKDFADMKGEVIGWLKLQSRGVFFKEQYEAVFAGFEDALCHYGRVGEIALQPFTFLTNPDNFCKTLVYAKNNIPRLFMQHGSYVHESLYLEACEIRPASVNMVLNEFTKQLVEKREYTSVEVVGSLELNKILAEKPKQYDFVYITYNDRYYNPSPALHFHEEDARFIIDPCAVYERHKSVVKMFGEQFSEYSICIKMHAAVVQSYLYIPLLELSEQYDNVTIEFNTPLWSLFEKSRYIISDYFSTEFVNYDLHFKRDIILFSDAPCPLSASLLEDMGKLFILTDGIDHLGGIVRNVEQIAAERVRDPDLIEYYSCKQVDTKSMVQGILADELGKAVGNG